MFERLANSLTCISKLSLIFSCFSTFFFTLSNSILLRDNIDLLETVTTGANVPNKIIRKTNILGEEIDVLKDIKENLRNNE